MDQELMDATAYAPGRCFVCTALAGWQNFSEWSDVREAILWRHIRYPTPLIDAHLLEEHSCQISFWSDLKRRSLGLFLKSTAPTITRIRTTTRRITRWVGSVPSWSKNYR